MADISTLGIKIDSSQIEKTIKSLDKLAESAAKVESATSKIAATMGAYVNSTKTASSEESKRQKAIDKMIEGLKQQEIRYSSGKTALVDYKLSLLNATEAERKQAKALSEKIQLMQDANKKSIDASDIMGKLATKVSALAAAYFGISAIKNFANEILETAKIADNFKYSLLAVSDSSEQAAETYKYLEKEANRLGQSITGNVDSFTGFMAAAKAANMTTEQAKKAYTGLNEAMTALHRTPEQASQALYALQQMLSTGTVRAQELNIQLGNAIPGAVPMFAQALGKTTAELRDMMQKGLVPANESVIQFTDYLSNKFAPSAEAASDSVQGNLNKMSNAAYNLKKAIVDAMGDNTTGIIKDATNALIDFTNALKTEEGKQFIADLSTTIKEAAAGALKLASALGSVLQYANLRSLSGTMEQAAELSKKGMLDIQKFATSSALERQRMVDDVLKKESELQKSQQETIKNQKELLKTITDTSIETKKAGDAFNRGWSPIVGTTAEITDQMRENEKTIKSISDKIKEQGITAGKTGVEKVRAELEAANATDEEKKAILGLAAANEQKENARKNAEKAQRKAEQDAEAAIRKAEAAEKARQGRIDSIIQKLKDQIATYKQGKEVSAEVALQHENATPQIIEYAKALGRELDQMKALSASQKEYDALMSKTAPDQVEMKRAEALGVVQKQFELTKSSAEEYGKAIAQVNKYYDDLENKDINSQLKETTKTLEDLYKVQGTNFGNELADGINNAVTSMQDLNEVFEDNKKIQNEMKKAQSLLMTGKGNPEERAEATKVLEKGERAMIEKSLHGYQQLFGSISQLYGENTKEREALHKIEMAFAAAEIAMNLQKTISAAYTAIMGQGGGDPYTAFARIAAMTALAAGIVSAAGGSLSGGGSGGGAASAAASTSSSTVLGSTEGSQSISNSLDFMTDIQSKQYNELRDINTGVESLNKNITGLVTSIVRNVDVDSVSGSVEGTTQSKSIITDLTGSYIGFTKDINRNIPILGEIVGSISDFLDDTLSAVSDAIFGGSKKTSILAQGLEVSTGKIGDLLDGMGVDIQKFADIKVKKEGGIFGSDKTYLKTITEELTPDEEDIKIMFTNVFKNMGETMVEVAKGLNISEDIVKAFTFNIDKIDLKGLTDSEDINKAISEALSTVADDAATQLFGQYIAKYQKVGEAIFETAIRIVSEKGVVEDILEMTNQSFADANIPEIALATTQSIIDLAGGIKQLQESSSTYFNEFFTDAEKQSRLYSQLSGAMASINLPMAENRKAFRATLEGINLNTEAGKEQYATLLNIADLADKYYDVLESGEKVTKDNSDAITSMVADTQKAIDQMDMSEFDKSIQNIKDNTEKSIKQLTNMGASESDLAVIREYGNKQIKELTDAHNQQIADEKIASASLRASKQLELDILNGVATEQDKVNFQRQQELKTLPESVQAIQQAIWAKEDEIAANEKAAKIVSEKSALELRIDELTMSSSDFLAKKRQLELAAMDGTLKPLQERIYQLEDEATANAKAAEIADKRQSLEIELLNLTGKSAEAVALQRKIELASLDDSLKPLQERVWALQDEAATTGNVNENITKKYELEIRLLELTGKTAEATAIKREKELVGLDATNRDLQKRIWALEDESEAIGKATEIANERKNLEVQLLELEGKSKEAVALQRQLELASINDSNKALKERIWLLQDEKETADAAKAIADQLAEQQKQYQEKVLSERLSLENELLQLQGNTTELRKRELESLDESNRSLQQRIWALQEEAELNSTISAAKQEIEGTRKSLQDELNNLVLDTDQLRAIELDNLRSGSAILKEKLKYYTDEKTLLDTQKTSLMDQWDAAKEKKDAIEAEIENLLLEKKKATGVDKEAIEDKIWLLKGDFNALKDSMTDYRKQILSLSESIYVSADKIDSITKAIESSDTEALAVIQQQIWAIQDAAKIAEEKATLEKKLIQETLSGTELIAYNRAEELKGLDATNKAIQVKIWQLQDEKEAYEKYAEKMAQISKEKSDLEFELLKLSVSESEALRLTREKELLSIDESNRSIQQAIWAREDEIAANEKIAQAEEDKINLLKDQLKTAEDVLKESVNKQIEYYQILADKAVDVFEKAKNDLEKAYQAEQAKIVSQHENLITSLTSRLEEAKDAASTLEDTFKSLSDARKSMEGDSAVLTYKEAQKQLFLALEMARKGDLAETKKFIPNIDAATSIEKEMYRSQEDYKRDFFKTYNALSELEGLTGGQLSEQEQIVKNLELQIETENTNHEENIKSLERQYNAVIGLDTSVKTFEQAIIDYQKAQYEADGANALLKQQTDQLNNQLNALLNIDNSVISVEEAIRQYQLIASQVSATSVSIPGYANGGMAEGMYMVGERGPEILTTPPAKITSNTDIKSMLNDEDVKRILAEIKEEISRGNFNIAKNTQETAKTLKKFDYDGMPETRV